MVWGDAVTKLQRFVIWNSPQFPTQLRNDHRCFGNFSNGLAKSPRLQRSSRILNECSLYCKIVKYCILSEVCMIKTVPHSTVSPQMWYMNGMKGWFTSTHICWQCKVVERKIRPDFFPGLINLRWWKATMALKCDRRLLLFLGVHMRLSTRGKIWFTLGLFANYLPKIS